MARVAITSFFHTYNRPDKRMTRVNVQQMFIDIKTSIITDFMDLPDNNHPPPYPFFKHVQKKLDWLDITHPPTPTNFC